jgi:Outer membrane protein
MNPGTWYQGGLLKAITLLLCMLSSACSANAQPDTVLIDLHQAEEIFLQHNLSLLAARYGIDANKALIRQARLWDNPVLATDQNIYDKQGGFFKHDQANGQLYFQVMQLIRTAGKRNKQAQLAEDATTISSVQFDDLLRTLRYALVSDLYEIDHQLKIKKVYDAEINELQKLVIGMDAQLQSGNISVKDNIRIKALMFSLRNELSGIEAQLMPLQEEVKQLLSENDSSFIRPTFTYHLPSVIKYDLPGLEQLEQTAIANRPDAKIARTQLAFQQHNYLYQKALAKPDINIGTEYDQRSSYAPNYVGLAISFPLPILNKNQGNISSAQFNIKQQGAILDDQVVKIQNEIATAYHKIKYYQQLNNLEQLEFSQQYDTLFRNMLTSYQQRQISLLEFVDFADAYKDTKLKILEQHSSLVRAFVELNYLVGEEVVILNK